MSNSSPNKALTFIFITVLIDVIGLGIIIPVIPALLDTLGIHDNAEASRYGGYLLFAYAIMNFLFAPVLGGLSDRYGRRPVLLIALAGLGLDYALHAVAPSLWLLFIGRILAGICGASFTTAQAYIADVSPPEKRAQNFGLVGAAFGLGFIIGPAIGGLLGSMGPRIPFWVAAGLCLANFLYGYFILPESLPADKRRAFSIRQANPLSSFVHLNKNKQVLVLIVALAFLFLSGYAVQGTWTFYTKGRLQWDERMIGYSLAFVGLVSAIVQGGLLGWLTKKFSTQTLLISSLILEFIGLGMFGIATNSWVMMLGILPYCTGNICGPVIQGAVSGQVPVNEQGALQGTITSVMSLCSIIGPVVMTELYAYFSTPSAPLYLPGAPFFLGMLLTVVAGIIVMGRRLSPAPAITAEAMQMGH